MKDVAANVYKIYRQWEEDAFGGEDKPSRTYSWIPDGAEVPENLIVESMVLSLDENGEFSWELSGLYKEF